MIVTNKKSWCDKSDKEIFDSLRDYILGCEYLLYSEEESLNKIARAYDLWSGADYVTAVHLLGENEPCFKIVEDWSYYLMGIEILKARKHEFFDE